MLNYLCRSCGLLGFGLNNDQKRLVLCIAAESPDSDDDEETSPPPTGFWANVSSFASTFVGGSDKGQSGNTWAVCTRFHRNKCIATRSKGLTSSNKCLTSSNKCLTSSNKKLLN